MKHIKYFENFNVSNIKKYSVWKSSVTNEILKICEITDNYKPYGIIFKQINYYNVNLKQVVKYHGSNKQQIFTNEDIEELVLYTSDNLEECLDVNLLDSLYISNKYNL